MKWIDPTAKDIRYRRRFAFFPVRMDRPRHVTVWLEFYWTLQRYSLGLATSWWIPIQKATKREYLDR
jgi:hypothetical protein